MKNRLQLSFSVPKLIIQLSFSFLIGYFIQQGFLDPWIHNRSMSKWLKSLLGFLSILLFFAPIFYLFVFRDLQRKNQRYRHYLDQYKKFQVILDESPLGALIYDQSGFLYVSKKFCSIVGYEEGEILGKKIQELEFIDPKSALLINENMKKRLANQTAPEYYIVSGYKNDGTKINVEIRARLSYFDGHAVILGTIIDVSERVKLEAALKESEQMYRCLFQSNMDIVLMIDLDGFIIDINQVAEQVSGYRRQDIIGQHFSQYVHPENYAKVEALFAEIMQGKPIRYEAKGVINGGGTVDVMVSAMPLYKNGQITGQFAFIKDITQQKQHLQIVQKWAYYDTLTGLPNRHYFNEKCLAILDEAKNKGNRAALMFLDLDRMKMVNDNLGHAAGDKLLQLSSERFQHVVTEDKGFLSRIGGDEFTVIIPQYQSIEEIINLAEELIQSLTAPFYIEDNYIQSKTSVGIALYPEHGLDMKTIMQAADIAMFEAKNSGGNHYKFYKPETDSALQRQFDFENDFSRAINNREFFLVYQPKVDAETRAIKGVEALVRWEHPHKGLISPADFIPMAEVSGLIVPLGEWVLREACSQAKQWQKLGLTSVRIAVNASALQFHQSNFSDRVQEILRETELDPKFLEIEITKGTFMEENEIVVSGVTKLMEMGVYISLDDFGTGYSSMKYLKQFRVQALKIDRAFIDKVDKYRERAAIVRSIVHLAHGLGMEVVAEGVETAEEMKLTKEYGVNEIQGYYISKPLSKQEFQKLLQHGKAPGDSPPPS